MCRFSLPFGGSLNEGRGVNPGDTPGGSGSRWSSAPASLLARLHVLFIFTLAAAGGRQLPPEILVDQLLLRAERLIQQEDTDRALEIIGEMLALQDEHGIEPPAEFHFRRAQATFAAGTLASAKELRRGPAGVAGPR